MMITTTIMITTMIMVNKDNSITSANNRTNHSQKCPTRGSKQPPKAHTLGRPRAAVAPPPGKASASGFVATPVSRPPPAAPAPELNFTGCDLRRQSNKQSSERFCPGAGGVAFIVSGNMLYLFLSLERSPGV